jgi:hypothetical protein
VKGRARAIAGEWFIPINVMRTAPSTFFMIHVQ